MGSEPAVPHCAFLFRVPKAALELWPQSSLPARQGAAEPLIAVWFCWLRWFCRLCWQPRLGFWFLLLLIEMNSGSGPSDEKAHRHALVQVTNPYKRGLGYKCDVCLKVTGCLASVGSRFHSAACSLSTGWSSIVKAAETMTSALCATLRRRLRNLDTIVVKFLLRACILPLLSLSPSSTAFVLVQGWTAKRLLSTKSGVIARCLCVLCSCVLLCLWLPPVLVRCVRR